MLLTITDLYRGAGSKFFNDQLMYSQDLNNIEYTKIKTIRDSIASMIIQSGVAIESLSEDALKVEYVDAAHFNVNSGSAIDKFGRLIYVPETPASGSGSIATDPYYHPAWPDRQNIPHNQVPNELTTYYVNIYYATQQDIAGKNDVGTYYYTREYDSYRISVDNVLPNENSGGICLASFPVDTDGHILSSGSINDLRPFLSFSMSSGTITTAREVFRRELIADEGSYVPLSSASWSTNNPFPNCKAYVSYRWDRETLMHVYFDVPTTSVAGQIQIYLYWPGGPWFESLLLATYAFASPGSYSFSFALPSVLLVNLLYYIGINMKNTVPGTAQIGRMLISVS